ncbi:helix-turn-helix transcriptional regulator [Streptomyces sp. 900105245]
MTTAVRPRSMLTLAEVCEELSISRSTFYDWRAKRRAPRCIKLPIPQDSAERPRPLARRPRGRRLMETTYDVKIYKILTYKGARKTTYTVRWVVAGKRWREPFGTVALAEGFRSELIRSTGKGEAFVIATGLPVSHRSKSAAMSWYAFAVEYVDARWAQLGGNSLKNIAKTLTATTVALLRTQPAQFEPAAVRTALREWGSMRTAGRRPHGTW